MNDDNLTESIEYENLLGMPAGSMGRDQSELVSRIRGTGPELVKAYMDTNYIVDHGGTKSSVRIGETIPRELEAWLEAHAYGSWAIISAYNPYSEELLEPENMRRHSLLDQVLCLRSLDTFRAVGRSKDGSWEEPSLFVGDIGYDVAKAIGTCFQQNAIVFSEKSGPIELVFCAT